VIVLRTRTLELLALVGIGLGLHLDCQGEEQVAPSWPAGTAVVVDGEPILASEVDADIDALLDIERAFGKTQRRRMILLHVALPRSFARAHHGQARAAARAEAQAWLESLEQGRPAGSQGRFVSGNWNELGLPVWLVARGLEPGQHSAVVELPGRFVVLRLENRDHNPNPALERLRVLSETFPFVEEPATLVDDYLDGTLEIVDPAWREIVPGFVEYKMVKKKMEQSS